MPALPSHTRLAILLCILLAPGVSAQAQTLEQNRSLPFQVDAAAVEVDQKTGNSVYRGKVVLSQGGMRLEAERVEVRMNRRRLDVVTATGKPVRLRALLENREDELLANAERIVFRVEAREIELTGNAWVRQGADEFRAHHMTYAIDEKRLVARGADGNADDSRVHAVFHPKPRAAAGENKP